MRVARRIQHWPIADRLLLEANNGETDIRFGHTVMVNTDRSPIVHGGDSGQDTIGYLLVSNRGKF